MSGTVQYLLWGSGDDILVNLPLQTSPMLANKSASNQTLSFCHWVPYGVLAGRCYYCLLWGNTVQYGINTCTPHCESQNGGMSHMIREHQFNSLFYGNLRVPNVKAIWFFWFIIRLGKLIIRGSNSVVTDVSLLEEYIYSEYHGAGWMMPFYRHAPPRSSIPVRYQCYDTNGTSYRQCIVDSYCSSITCQSANISCPISS